MSENQGGRPNLLGEQIDKRLRQLGMSRRELSRHVPISRQTLHELEHNPGKGFAESTFDALDHGLKWEPGTAKLFHQGNHMARNHAGDASIDERIDEYLRRIIARLAEMDIDQLEREVLMLEEESYGQIPARNVKTSKLVGRHIEKLLKACKSWERNPDEEAG